LLSGEEDPALKIHPNGFTLEEFLVSLSRQHLEVVDHLIGCTTCRRRFQGLVRQRSMSKKTADILLWRKSAEDGPPKGESPVLLDREKALAKERVEAPGLFVELTRLPVEQQNLLLNSERFHSWGLLELLLERSLEAGINHPVRGEELGRLAVRLCEHLDAEHYGAALIEDLRARAWGYIGNSYRLRCDFQQADEIFVLAHEHLRKGTQDSLERAILLDLEASLRREQRRFEEAAELLGQLEEYRRGERDEEGLVGTLLSRAIIHEEENEPARAVEKVVQALELMSWYSPLRLHAYNALVDNLVGAGLYPLARTLLKRTRRIYRRAGKLTLYRLCWLEGRIAFGLGEDRVAEGKFNTARLAFIRVGKNYDAARVGLDLALLLVRQELRQETSWLIGDMLQNFRAQRIGREVIASLALLKRSCEGKRSVEALSLQIESIAATLMELQRERPRQTGRA